ncbi:hypothetical protein [Celeribacter sp.]|uniref:hypothetical protein n=1 Tax=Celeribacter sp. TaxID=1890673 RepID=UPI003A959F2F
MSVKDRVIIASVVLACLAMAPLAVLSAPYRDGPALAVIAPWNNMDAVLVDAGLREIAPLRAPFGALVLPDPDDTRADLRSHGVWTLLDGALIAAICGVDNA